MKLTAKKILNTKTLAFSTYAPIKRIAYNKALKEVLKELNTVNLKTIKRSNFNNLSSFLAYAPSDLYISFILSLLVMRNGDVVNLDTCLKGLLNNELATLKAHEARKECSNIDKIKPMKF